MAAELAFEWDSRELAVFRGKTLDRALTRAMRLGGNQALKSLRLDATAFALSRKRLSEQTITEDQDVEKPDRKTELRDFVWRLWVKGKPVPAAKFPHSMSGLGAIVTFGGATRLIGHAFTARMKSGHLGIYHRRGDKRLPIDEVFSSRLPARFGADVMLTYADKTYRKLETAFTRGLDRELAKLKRKGEA